MPWYVRLLARLPLPVVHLLGAAFGAAALLLRGRLRRQVRRTLTRAGLYSRSGLLRVAMGLGRGVLEVVPVWSRPLDEVVGWIREVHGWERVEQAHARGKGLLILIPHLGCWELGGLYYAARLPVTALYRPPRQPWAHLLMKSGRERGHSRTVAPDRAGVKALLSALKHNEAAFILPDQVANKGEGAWLPFLGLPAYMPTLPYRLLKSTDAAAVLFFCERLGWRGGYRLWIEPLDDLPEAAGAAAAEVNRRVEALVRHHPEQYLWSYPIHRRPRGVPPPEVQAAG
jgi:Kdo2-lipid IVA lauroyltransferase/acyltransferase